MQIFKPSHKGPGIKVNGKILKTGNHPPKNKIEGIALINNMFAYSPKKKKRFTFNRSPHVNSKAKEHFTIFTYKRLVYLSFQEFTHLSELLSSLSNDLSIVIKKNS